MWAFLESLFHPKQPPTPELRVGPVGAVAKRLTADEKVRKIQHFLDNHNYWPPHDPRRKDEYNMIDWDVSPSGKIVAPLYLGGVRALQDRAFMRKIGAVVSIIDPERFPKFLLDEFVGPKRSYLYLPLDDDPRENISKYFEKSYQFIKNQTDQGIPVFVHCVQGKSRSSTIVAYYLMRKYGITAIEALNMVKSKRPIICPNPGFIKALVDHENPN